MRIPHKAHAVSSRLDPVGRKVQRRRLGIPKAVGADAGEASQNATIAPPGARRVEGWVRLGRSGEGSWKVACRCLGEELVVELKGRLVD